MFDTDQAHICSVDFYVSVQPSTPRNGNFKDDFYFTFLRFHLVVTMKFIYQKNILYGKIYDRKSTHSWSLKFSKAATIFRVGVDLFSIHSKHRVLIPPLSTTTARRNHLNKKSCSHCSVSRLRQTHLTDHYSSQ
jgi:hypothetical protein